MKNLFTLIFLACILMLPSSCSKDEGDNTDSSVVGVWKLTSYDIGLSVDIDKNETKSFNILDEIDCSVNCF